MIVCVMVIMCVCGDVCVCVCSSCLQTSGSTAVRNGFNWWQTDIGSSQRKLSSNMLVTSRTI